MCSSRTDSATLDSSVDKIPQRGAGGPLPQQPDLTEDACLQERPHQVKDATVPDPLSHQTPQGRVRDLAKHVLMPPSTIHSYLRGLDVR